MNCRPTPSPPQRTALECTWIERSVASCPPSDILQSHQDQGARIPALFGHHVQTCRADIPDAVRLGSAAGPVIGGQAGRGLPGSFSRIGRPPALQPILGRPDVSHSRLDEAHLVSLFCAGARFGGALLQLQHAGTAAPKRLFPAEERRFAQRQRALVPENCARRRSISSASQSINWSPGWVCDE